MLQAVKLQIRAGLTVSFVTIRYLPEMLCLALKYLFFQTLIFYRPYRDQRYDVAVQLQTFGSFRSLGCKAMSKSLEQRINEKQENIKTNIGKQYQRLCDRSLRLKSSPSVIASSMRGVVHTDASEKTVCMCSSPLRVLYPSMSGMTIR